MRKLAANAYEAQLTPEERAQLHALFLQPKCSLLDVRAQAPLWHQGPFAGSKPSLMALSRMARRFRNQEHLLKPEVRSEIFRQIDQKLAADPVFSGDSSQMLDKFYRLLSHQLMDDLLTQQNLRYRAPQFRMLLRCQEQLSDRVQFQRAIIIRLIDGYQNHQLRNALEKTEPREAKIQNLSALLFGQLG